VPAFKGLATVAKLPTMGGPEVPGGQLLEAGDASA
jgi:hypothetical protein